MSNSRKQTILIAALSVVLWAPPLPAKSNASHWVGTWASAPLLVAHAKPAEELVAPGAQPGVTLREIVHVSLGGETLRCLAQWKSPRPIRALRLLREQTSLSAFTASRRSPFLPALWR